METIKHILPEDTGAEIKQTELQEKEKVEITQDVVVTVKLRVLQE